MAAADLPCWHSFVQYHRAVGLALLSAAHAREAAHHFATSAVALARATALSAQADWGPVRQLVLLMAATSALVPQLPLPVDRLMQLVNRLGVSPSHPLPSFNGRLCDPVRRASKTHAKPLFSPFVAATFPSETITARDSPWTAFIESAGLDAAVALLSSAGSGADTQRGAKLFRMQRLVAWMQHSGVVMPVLL